MTAILEKEPVKNITENPGITKSSILSLLNSTKLETLAFFDVPEEELAMSYGNGKWSIRQILHHLTDSELIFQERLKRIIAEPKQVIWAYNQDEWNDAFDYKNEPLKNKKQLYKICRELNCELVEKYYDRFCEKEFVHSITGVWTLKVEFERVATHNQSHIKQIETALAKGKS